MGAGTRSRAGTVKTSGAETGGRLAQVEVDDPLGTAPPLHIHYQEDETFYVLEGEVTIFADGERIDASAGDFALVPPAPRTRTSFARSGPGC